jgi:hypothetical protein
MVTMKRMKKQFQAFQDDKYGLTEADLLSVLNVEQDIIINDYHIMHTQSQEMQESDYQLATGIYQNIKFFNWHGSISSTALMLEKVDTEANSGRTPALSAVSCSVITHLDSMRHAFCIHHFCNMHVDPNSPAPGSAGMIRSFICQILRLFSKRVSLGFTSERQYRKQLQSQNLDLLCECFKQILVRLPPGTLLFCVIDGVDYLESSDRNREYLSVIEELLNIVRGDESYPVFKLLVTSASRSRVTDMFSADERMILGAKGWETRDNPSERDMYMGMRRSKAKESPAFRGLREGFMKARAELSDSGSSFDPSEDDEPATGAKDGWNSS